MEQDRARLDKRQLRTEQNRKEGRTGQVTEWSKTGLDWTKCN